MIYEVKMYSGKCDNCGCAIELGGGEYSAYAHIDSVQEEMGNSEWHIEETGKGKPNKHYCPDCFTIGDDDNIVINESRKKQQI
jgi:hypothetical protein